MRPVNNDRVYDEMTWQEIAEAAAAQTPVVIPIGATEQHGPHLPVSTDWVLPKEILRVASGQRRILAGPAVTFGYKSRPASGGGQRFPGTVSLRATTLMALLTDILTELIRAGFRNLVIYNWHYENTNFVYEPAYLVGEQHPDVKIVVIESAIPDAFSPDLIQTLWPDGFPGLALEHAAVIETSLWMWHRESAVRAERMRADAPERNVAYDVIPIDDRMSTASGSLSSPLGSSAEKGELLAELLVDHLVTIIDQEFPGLAVDEGELTVVAPDVVFITGAAGGIGRATALEFAGRGFVPVVTDLGRGDQLEQLAKETGGLAIDLDVSQPAAVARAITDAEAALGAIDTAVCCAGFDVDLTLQETDDAAWQRSFAVLLGGCVNVIAALAPNMKERGHGSFVLISSELALIGEENHVSYVSAKAAILGLTRAMAHELGGHGIRVNSIAPGPTDTPMLTDRYRASAEYISRIPLRRFGAPAELAKAIADLAGSTWTTGQIVSPNGGIVIQ